jgi:hypothetical protein
MTTQLPTLLMLQEVDALLRDLVDPAWREKEKALGFSLGSATKLRSERARLALTLSPELLRRYEQVRTRHPRAVAPVRRGTCLGCFTVRPAFTATQGDRLEVCERCGRILFRLEERGLRPAEPARSPRPSRRAGRTRR